jgi:hypothetical protein
VREQQAGAYEGGSLGELVDAWLSFDGRLRSGSGFDVAAYERPRRALRGCAEEWAVHDAVPQEGANVLVDVFPATEANAGVYEGEVAEQVMDAAYELHDLVSACVALPEPAPLLARHGHGRHPRCEGNDLTLSGRARLLREAGFSQAGSVWQFCHSHVAVVIR